MTAHDSTSDTEDSSLHQAHIIDGRAESARIIDELSKRPHIGGREPCLAVILVGDNPASHVYVGQKIKACAACGILSRKEPMKENSEYTDVSSVIRKLNQDPTVDGILLQLPLPPSITEAQQNYLIQLIDPRKDVDGLTVTNMGKLMAGNQLLSFTEERGLIPCTPQGALHLIKTVEPDLTGLHAVVIGRSLLFGKPMGQLLLGENATVTMAHSKTRDLGKICAQADIVVAAVGRPRMVQGDWIKPGAIVIDVGINRLDNGKLCGDVDFDAVRGTARAITPVPGGVGPMTIAYLMANTLKAYELRLLNPQNPL
ncbi:MAG: bifunctional 5,10-methylenetetrahydrofolate dehydrogenase/5,10-methenyltetrahydrofolate cyclohydrolase [Alphaproteobacteria bacterium]|nr:bifunctional 5,10-methylenetetrahydrofolate dehydrogenase/5,10-methenyltetrahydrofolate cyclohydrolase [Alphaproteobacteria bacterium]